MYAVYVLSARVHIFCENKTQIYRMYCWNGAIPYYLLLIRFANSSGNWIWTFLWWCWWWRFDLPVNAKWNIRLMSSFLSIGCCFFFSVKAYSVDSLSCHFILFHLSLFFFSISFHLIPYTHSHIFADIEQLFLWRLYFRFISFAWRKKTHIFVDFIVPPITKTFITCSTNRKFLILSSIKFKWNSIGFSFIRFERTFKTHTFAICQ